MIDSRTFDAASRLLAAVATQGKPFYSERHILSAWLGGRGGARAPKLEFEIAQPLIDTAVALGARRYDDALRIIEEEAILRARGEGGLLVGDAATFLGGAEIPERLVELARRVPAAIGGRQLVGTSRPDELLALHDERGGPPAQTVIAELVVRYRDAGTPLAIAEERWRAYVAGLESPTASPGGRYWQVVASLMRVTVRESLDDALAYLAHKGEASYRWEGVYEGTLAVLGRLGRVDPARAAQFVFDGGGPSLPPAEASDLIPWLRALAWDFALPPGVEPILETCFSKAYEEERLPLAAALVSARRLDLLDRAIAAVPEQEPMAWVEAMAPDVKRMREAGLDDDAEAVRARVAPLVGDAIDWFDVMTAADLPNQQPWARGTQLP